jgi:hypothetical protein
MNVRQQVQQVVAAMFDESSNALKASVSELKASLATLTDFVNGIELPERGPGRPPGQPTAVAPHARKRRRRRSAPGPVAAAPTVRPRGKRGPGRAKRGAGEFAATSFILAAVKAGKGVRPRDIVALIEQAAPGHHTRPSALVSTILTRLKRKGEVRRRAGKWYAA